jgi:hypothetical protein
MKAGRKVALFISAIGVVVGAYSWYPARAQPQSGIGTRELLNILLTTPAADQPISERGPCLKANDATSVRGDVIFFLSKLSKPGSIKSECQASSDVIACQLVIGQNIGRGEGVWTRTYVLSLGKVDHRPKEPIECYTIP